MESKSLKAKSMCFIPAQHSCDLQEVEVGCLQRIADSMEKIEACMPTATAYLGLIAKALKELGNELHGADLHEVDKQA